MASVRNRWTVIFLVSSAVTIYACGDDDSTSLGGPCATVYAGQCGGACTRDQDCGGGLHCDAQQVCNAVCSPAGGECGAGEVCDENGRCGAASDTGTGAGFTAGTGTDGDGGEDDTCGSVDVAFDPIIPTVALLIDRSSSMNGGFAGTSTSRWDVVESVLTDPQNGLVPRFETQVRFSMHMYTVIRDQQPPATCPQMLEANPPTLNASAGIDALYADDSIGFGGTPSGQALEQVATALNGFDQTGPKLILLATDGEPDSCEQSNGNDVTRQLVVDAATTAFSNGIATVVVSVDGGVSEAHQQAVANAGAGLPAPPSIPCDATANPTECAPIFRPDNQQALAESLEEIIKGQRSCVFTLDGEVIDGKECEGTVTVNGTPVPCNADDGYRVTSPNQIE
ncbi:MAG: hypothetical protein AAGA56_28275, partial [Myxococcota bacterium]